MFDTSKQSSQVIADPPSQEQRSRSNATGRSPAGVDRAALTFSILAIGACGMGALLALLPAAGHDQMWLLYASRLMLHGAPLYGPEIFETNPPMILWLSALPTGVAGLLHVSETAMGKLFVVILAWLVGLACVRLVRGLCADSQDGRLSRGTLYALTFAFVTIFVAMVARDFGQRDHLLALLCVPYVFAAALCVEGRRLARWVGVVIGAAALAGIVMKPHQVLIPIAVETTVLGLRLRRRERGAARSLLRPVFVAMIASGATFLLAVEVFTPAYFTRVVPLVRDTYWAFSQWSFAHLLGESVQLHVLAAVALGMFFMQGWGRTSALVWALLSAGLASLLAYYVQGTGWYYQQIPSLTFFALALTFLLIEGVRRRDLKVPGWAPKAAAALSVLALGLTAHFSRYPFTAARSFPIEVPDASFYAGLAPGAAVMTVSTTVDYILPPIYKYDLTLGQRFPLYVMLPAILRSEDPQGGRLKRHLSRTRVEELDAFQTQAMREDLARWKPQLVLVERCQDPTVHCQVLEDRHDDLLRWFLRDAGVRAEFAGYRYWRSAGTFDAYVPQ